MTRIGRFRILILGVLCILLAPMAASAQIVVTFESLTLAHNDKVGTLDGVIFGEGWAACVDADGGGFCDIANEPTPSTVASISGVDDTDTRITFPQPVKTVSFFYSAQYLSGAPEVFFYNSSDELLGMAVMSACGATYCGNGCTGDPGGGFCSWTYLTYTSSSSRISYMEFTPPGFHATYYIDNLTLLDPLNRNGFWAPPGQTGGAIAIDIRGNDLAVGWGAYDKETGEPSWMYSEGTMTDANHYTGPLWQFGGGQCFDCPYTDYTEQNTMGTISITFNDDTSAIIDALGITKYVEKVD